MDTEQEKHSHKVIYVTMLVPKTHNNEYSMLLHSVRMENVRRQKTCFFSGVEREQNMGK